MQPQHTCDDGAAISLQAVCDDGTIGAGDVFLVVGIVVALAIIGVLIWRWMRNRY